MKTLPLLFVVILASNVFCIPEAVADTLLFSSGQTASGTVLHTNNDEILLLTPHAAYNFSKSFVKQVKIDAKQPDRISVTNRLSSFQQAILVLSKQPWATNIMPIPATVIDKGILSNVPYSSFHCGDNYEVNIYGDLDRPAGIEIGIYNVLGNDEPRQGNCIKFMGDLLTKATDKALVQALDLKKDLKNLDDLTFEITPPSGEDSYNGWWVSIYSTKELSLARASDAEMKRISMSKSDAPKKSSGGESSRWSADELKNARIPIPTTITFTDKDGQTISNAAVRIFKPGVSLIWETTNGAAGLVKLADLPQDLQDSFGYDPGKASAANASEKEKQEEQLKQYYAAKAALAAQQAQNTPPPQSSGDWSGLYSGGGSAYSGGGRVYVHGYTRKDGTYVSAYTRRR